MNVDIWTTNEQQRHEIFEQLGVLFNPSMEVQSTDNFIDWTSLSVIYQDGITWNSRSIPAGTGNDINITTWKFYMPVWVSSPIKVQKLGIIHKIIASIFKGAAISDMTDDDLLLGTREKITPYGYQLLLIGNQLQILPQGQPMVPSNASEELPLPPNTSVYWQAVINAYGTIRPGISQIRIENPFVPNGEIVGTIAFNPTDDRLMIYNIDIDTLPQNSLTPIDRIIDPQAKTPGLELPQPANGQRYLVVNDIPSNNYQLVSTTQTVPAGEGTVRIYINFIPTGTVAQSFGVGTEISAYDQYNEPYFPANTSITDLGIDENGAAWIEVNNGSPQFKYRTVPAYSYLSTNIWIGTTWGQFYSGNSSDSVPVSLVDANSIIEYDGINNRWFVAFDPILLTDVQYVTNLFTDIQYRWAEGIWAKAWEGFYDQGSWNIVI
jgi:hypothetical protein